MGPTLKELFGDEKFTLGIHARVDSEDDTIGHAFTSLTRTKTEGVIAAIGLYAKSGDYSDILYSSEGVLKDNSASLTLDPKLVSKYFTINSSQALKVFGAYSQSSHYSILGTQCAEYSMNILDTAGVSFQVNNNQHGLWITAPRDIIQAINQSK